MKKLLIILASLMMIVGSSSMTYANELENRELKKVVVEVIEVPTVQTRVAIPGDGDACSCGGSVDIVRVTTELEDESVTCYISSHPDNCQCTKWDEYKVYHLACDNCSYTDEVWFHQQTSYVHIYVE